MALRHSGGVKCLLGRVYLGLGLGLGLYNSLFQHNSFLYTVSHIWNQLPSVAKASTFLTEFRQYIANVKAASNAQYGRTCLSYSVYM